MLVLSRKQGEQIRIGDDISVTVLRTSTGRVKIGVEAPRDVKVVRGECHDEPSLLANLPELPAGLKTTDSFDSVLL